MDVAHKDGDDNEHFHNLYSDLANLTAQGHLPATAHERLKQDQNSLYGQFPEVLGLRVKALERAYAAYQAKLNEVKYLQKKAIRNGREQWYAGPASEGSLWSQLESALKELGRPEKDVGIVDEDSTTVVGLLDNPAKESFSTRGLVVGHVQSGKTGNIAAVINKGAETHYKFFLVLSGLTDQLRNQTQLRLEKDVVSLAPERWMKWTAADTETTKGDFSEKAQGGFGFDQRNQIAVIKKNGAVLRRFLAKVRNTNAATLASTPFLIIDDECDQASINSAKYEKAVTKINDLIRQLLKALPRAAYVGYTATPFANVLIDTTVPEDLYPRDFICAIRHPDGYFGAADLFGQRALDGEYDESAGYDMIRLIPADEVDVLRPPPSSNASAQLTDSLKDAIRYFVMVIAARRARGDTESHNTMLVHTSFLNSVHQQMAAAIRPFVKQLCEDLLKSDAACLEAMVKQWVDEQEKVLSEQFDMEAVSFEALRPFLQEAARDITVHVENWRAIERLDYSTGGPKTYIVIGGNVLARGLTLEGLSVSLFLRTSSQYDTLMQMGRWFGYRRGFEDLPRIWVEERVREAFFDLATVEAELRRDIARYAEEELLPTDFGPRIRKIPGMAITAPAKMRHAVAVQIGYTGTHVQTFRFNRVDVTQLTENWGVAATLIENALKDGAKRDGNVLRQVPYIMVKAFLKDYQPHKTHKNLDPVLIGSFVEKAGQTDEAMRLWNVVVVAGSGAGGSIYPLGPLGKVDTVIRSAEVHSGDDPSIKALMSRGDVLLDLPNVTASKNASWDELKAIRKAADAPPLLLLYPIQAESAPQKSAKPKTREPLNAKRDVLGYGIVFPGDKKLSGTYVAANLTPDSEEPADEVAEPDRIPDEVLDSTNGPMA